MQIWKMTRGEFRSFFLTKQEKTDLVRLIIEESSGLCIVPNYLERLRAKVRVANKRHRRAVMAHPFETPDHVLKEYGGMEGLFGISEEAIRKRLNNDRL